jgi:uncharacterized protein (TIGR03435 family)
MRPFRGAVWLLAALAGVACAQHKGDIPPQLVWTALKGDCPASLDWASLQGTVVVVSFLSDPVFATGIIDWSRIDQKFRGEQVLFVRVVSGSEFLLDQALKQAAFRGCVLFDRDQVNLRNFKLPHFDRTVVVDQLGVIAGYSRGTPAEQAIRSVLNRQPDTGLSEFPPQPRAFDPARGLDDATSYDVHISPAQKGEFRSLGAWGPDRYIAKNQPLKAIILDLWSTPFSRLEFPEKLAEGSYDVTAHIPVADREVLLQVVREAVEQRFGLRVEKQEQIKTAYLLTALPKPTPQLQASKSDEQRMSGGGQGSIAGTAQSMQEIASVLEQWLNVPVIDGTGLKGKYNYSASSKSSGPGAAFDLAHQLGLDLVKTERPIEMLIVRSVK